METDSERVRRKLVGLIATHGKERIAELANLSPAYLEQIVKATKMSRPRADGTHTERNLGAAARRAIEKALKKERGWFDNDENLTGMIAGRKFSARALDLAMQFDELALTPPQMEIAFARASGELGTVRQEAASGTLRSFPGGVAPAPTPGAKPTNGPSERQPR